jgi:transposase
MDLYIGADWSATFVSCAVARGAEPARDAGKAKRSLDSIQELFERCGVEADDHVHVVIEAGDEGWVRLFHAKGADVHVVDPKQAKRFGESLRSSGAKDDKGDARTLVAIGQSPRHLPSPWSAPSRVHRSLGVLAVDHEQLTIDIGRIQQRIRGDLRQHMPAVAGLLPNLRSKWVRRLLHAVPTPWHAKGMSRAEFDEAIADSRIRPAVLEAVWTALTATENPWMEEDDAQTYASVMRRRLANLAHLDEALHAIDRQIDELTAAIPARALLETMAGVGLQQGVVLVLNGVEQATTRDEVANRMGATPVFRGSSTTPDGRPKGGARMRRAASPRAKRAVYLIGRLASQRLAWARAMYTDARSRGQSAAAAYRRIARSVLRILTAMLSHNEPYDDARYIAVLKTKGVPWAANL